jgi:hypothetical protein
MGDLKPIRIVVVGPTDVDSEKAMVDAVVWRMADGAGRRGFALLRPTRWERLDAQASPKGVQRGIEDELRIEDCDVVIAILWKKYGKPDDTGYSPTAREILKAIAANRASGGRPVEDDREHEHVAKFKEEISDQVRYIDFGRPQISDYDRPERFDLLIRDELGEVLDDLTLADRTWSCSVASTVVLARDEGFVEPVSDIRLTLKGPRVPSGRVNLEVSVFIDTYVTNRELPPGGRTLDVALTAEKDATVWRGETRKTRTNAVVFGPVSRAVPDAGFYETFVIKGIRVNSTRSQSSISALVEVAISDDSGMVLSTKRELVGLALSVR